MSVTISEVSDHDETDVLNSQVTEERLHYARTTFTVHCGLLNSTMLFKTKLNWVLTVLRSCVQLDMISNQEDPTGCHAYPRHMENRPLKLNAFMPWRATNLTLLPPADGAA